MSDANEANGQATGGNATNQETDNRVKNAEAVLKKNEELLGAIRQLKDDNASLKQKVTDFENSALASEGKKDELIEKYKLELTEAKSTAENTKKAFASSYLETRFKSEAKAKGCVNPDDLYALARSRFTEKGIEVSVDLQKHQVSIDDEKISSLISSLSEEKGYLFSSEGVRVKDKKPGTGGSHGSDTKTFEDEIRAAKTQAELDVVLKKYNKI